MSFFDEIDLADAKGDRIKHLVYIEVRYKLYNLLQTATKVNCTLALNGYDVVVL